MQIVSIMAHQDDEMYCLGTMLRCQARGDKLCFITVTDGSKGFVQNPAISRPEAGAIRNREMAALANAIGAGYINLWEPDEFLYDTPEIRLKLVEAIRKSKADLIFTHYHHDYNLDHTTVNALVRQCALHACLPVLSTDSAPLKEHPAIFMIEPHGPIDFPATHYVDITACHDRKAPLLLSHASQEEAMQKALGSGLRELSTKVAAYRGLQVGCAYAECFCPMQARGAVKPHSVLP